MVCPGYSDIRQDFDLNNDRDLVNYFSQVVKIRLEKVDANIGTRRHCARIMLLKLHYNVDCFKYIYPI